MDMNMSYRQYAAWIPETRKKVDDLVKEHPDSLKIYGLANEFKRCAKAFRVLLRMPESDFHESTKKEEVDAMFLKLKAIVMDLHGEDAKVLVEELREMRHSLDENIVGMEKKNVALINSEKEKKNVAKNKRGGKRAGAGRNAIGERRVVSISLEDWTDVDEAIASKEVKSVSEYFRRLYEMRSEGIAGNG